MIVYDMRYPDWGRRYPAGADPKTALAQVFIECRYGDCDNVRVPSLDEAKEMIVTGDYLHFLGDYCVSKDGQT